MLRFRQPAHLIPRSRMERVMLVTLAPFNVIHRIFPQVEHGFVLVVQQAPDSSQQRRTDIPVVLMRQDGIQVQCHLLVRLSAEQYVIIGAQARVTGRTVFK